MKKIMFAIGFALLSTVNAFANDVKADVQISVDKEYAEGEIKKLDLSRQKVTIKHGDIKSVDMPPMTMIFTLKNEELGKDLEVGQKILFYVEKIQGKYTITDLNIQK